MMTNVERRRMLEVWGSGLCLRGAIKVSCTLSVFEVGSGRIGAHA
jgi:hypothetical protein